MPYTDDPASVPSDEVRFLVGDVNAAKPLLTDNQVAFLLSEEGDNPLRAAARAAETLAAQASGQADRKRVGPLWLDFQKLAERYSKLATRLWSRANLAGPYAGGVSVLDKNARELDSDRVKPAFRRRIMSYPGGTRTTEDRISPPELIP